MVVVVKRSQLKMRAHSSLFIPKKCAHSDETSVLHRWGNVCKHCFRHYAANHVEAFPNVRTVVKTSVPISFCMRHAVIGRKKMLGSCWILRKFTPLFYWPQE